MAAPPPYLAIEQIPGLARAYRFTLGLERDCNSTRPFHYPSLYIPLGRVEKGQARVFCGKLRLWLLHIADPLVQVIKTLDSRGGYQIGGTALKGIVRRGARRRKIAYWWCIRPLIFKGVGVGAVIRLRREVPTGVTGNLIREIGTVRPSTGLTVRILYILRGYIAVMGTTMFFIDNTT